MLRYSYYTAGSGGAGPTILETSMLLAGEECTVYKEGQSYQLPPISNRREVDFGPGARGAVCVCVCSCGGCRLAGCSVRSAALAKGGRHTGACHARVTAVCCSPRCHRRHRPQGCVPLQPARGGLSTQV
jgi:hypothetical protein